MGDTVTFMSMLGGFAALTYGIVRFTVTKVWAATDRRAAEESAWMRTQAERQMTLIENHLAHNTEALLALRSAIGELVAHLERERRVGA